MSIPKIIVALDKTNRDDIDNLLNQLTGLPIWIKVGMEVYYAYGNHILFDIKEKGFPIFLDLKLHDIPQTVFAALGNLLSLPIDMINVHCLGGLEMLKRAKEAQQNFSPLNTPPLLIGVTILTSLNDKNLKDDLSIDLPVENYCLQLATLASKAGLDGVVCSPWESAIIKETIGNHFKTITPGIRLDATKADDQKRIATPLEAKNLKSDFLVIGRPVTQSKSPKETVLNIFKEIQ